MIDTDRELLELAAKAAGFVGEWKDHGGQLWLYCLDFSDPWNPLENDGDAFRLAVKLGLLVDCSRPSASPAFHAHCFGQADYTDKNAAARRAIVRAAADIGRNMR